MIADFVFILIAFLIIVDMDENNFPSQKQIEKEGSDSQQVEEKEKGEEVRISKKELKRQKKQAKWEEMKKVKREKEKARKKKKKQLKKIEELQNKEVVENQSQKLFEGNKVEIKMRKRKDQYKEKMLDNQIVIIDLQFYDAMTEKEQISLGKQLAYCHSVNRKAEKPFNYIVSSVTQPRLNFLSERYSANNWGITLKEEHIFQLLDKEKIVYLTGDAEEELREFDPNDVYIIGGIVDHNRLKSITINYANQHKIRARRLPMQGLKLKASVHLAVNHVWEWMLHFYNGSSWKQAIKRVIPERKLHQVQKK